jgi:hypothetical protein
MAISRQPEDLLLLAQYLSPVRSSYNFSSAEQSMKSALAT